MKKKTKKNKDDHFKVFTFDSSKLKCPQENTEFAKTLSDIACHLISIKGKVKGLGIVVAFEKDEKTPDYYHFANTDDWPGLSSRVMSLANKVQKVAEDELDRDLLEKKQTITGKDEQSPDIYTDQPYTKYN